jgi:hypothetical protein
MAAATDGAVVTVGHALSFRVRLLCCTALLTRTVAAHALLGVADCRGALVRR